MSGAAGTTGVDVAIAPVLLGSREHLWPGLDLLAAGDACTEHVTTKKATHFVLRRGGAGDGPASRRPEQTPSPDRP
jgi:hypothetical protein